MTYSFDDTPDRHTRLLQAHRMAMDMLGSAERDGLFRAGVTELELSREIQSLGQRMFGTFKHWHKRIVRAGPNTLSTFGDTPADLRIEADDMVFVDLGPMFESWEADIGRTYVIGSDPEKIRLRDAIEAAWHSGRDHFRANRESVTGADMYELAVETARAHGYVYPNWHAGHLIGNFPHEIVQGELRENYLHPGNTLPLSAPDHAGNPRTWIYEVHFVDPERGYGGFFEQWLELDDGSAGDSHFGHPCEAGSPLFLRCTFAPSCLPSNQGAETVDGRATEPDRVQGAGRPRRLPRFPSRRRAGRLLERRHEGTN